MVTAQNKTEKLDILKEAIHALTNATGVKARMQDTNGLIPDENADAQIKMIFRAGNQDFNVQIKGEMRQTMLSRILGQFGRQLDKWLLVSRYIPGPLKTELRKQGINYLEVTGNCYISTSKLYLYVNDRPVKHARATVQGRLWKASGMKLLFLLIQDPTLIGATYRQLSQLAGIALGSISPLLDELRQENFLQKEDNGDKETLVQRDRLIRRWSELYPLTLRPKLLIGQFRFTGLQMSDNREDIPAEGVYWGGEPAAELYIHYLIPETYMLYTDRPPNELVRKLGIVPDKDGSVAVLQKFWQDWPGSRSKPGTVPPLLVYADLLNTDDSRGWKAAQSIKKIYLDGKPVS